jgi:hypothetical protein
VLVTFLDEHPARYLHRALQADGFSIRAMTVFIGAPDRT